MQNFPIIAVLMTLYTTDRSDYFEQALESIASQDYPPESVRLYLSTNGPVSAANQKVLVAKKEMFYKVLNKPVDQGFASALNDLLNVLEDETYVLRMDSDDRCLEGRFTRQIAFMEKNPEISLLGANAQDIDENGAFLKSRCYPEFHDQIVGSLHKLNPILHPTYCIRAARLQKDRIRYQLVPSEDWAFLFDVVKLKWRLHNLQEPLLQWRTSAKFFERRFGFKRGWNEFKVCLRGNWKTFGVTPKLFWAFGRLGLRIVPVRLARWLYQSKVRAWLMSR